MTSKYVDVKSIINVIGNIYKNPKLLDDVYTFVEEDFPIPFHRIVFGALYNIWQGGNIKSFNHNIIEDYLASRPKAYKIFKDNNGLEYLTRLETTPNITLDTFEYYYERMKKFSLLRAFEQMLGMDLKDIYDPDNIIDLNKKQEQEEWLDNTSRQAIAQIITDKIDAIKQRYVEDSTFDSCEIGEGIDEYLEQLAISPDYGYPLYGKYINTICRGARFKKLYLRSAATNVGKTRAMVADACYLACDSMYLNDKKGWVELTSKQPVLLIASEQELNEIQASCLAFISNVNEEHITTNKYVGDEKERVIKAVKILKESKLRFEYMPDYSLKDIEECIKYNIREYGAKFIFFDYVHTSLGILEEITKRSGGVKLREDNILFMMSTQLKNIALRYSVFILSSTQLSADYKDAEIFDQNLLRGAKSIADSIDYGSILLQISQKDKEALAPLCEKQGIEMPNIKMSVYKNRGNRWKDILVWINADRGTCRFDPVFVTNYDYTLVDDIKDIKIEIKGE